MNRTIVVEDAIGETRAALIEDGRVAELHIDRWSERESRAAAGAVYLGRVRRVDGSLNAAFVDLGVGPDGFLPFGKAGRPAGFHEGAAWPVEITREAHAEKGPTLASVEAEASGDAPRLLTPALPLADRLAARYPDAKGLWSDESDIDLDAEIEAALSVTADIPGGGRLIIEKTAALTAIDVDAAGRTAQGGAQKLAADLNRSAAKEAARQIRLRGLGGIVAIDFVHMRDRKARTEVEQALRRTFKRDPARVDVAPMSPFGIVELARQRTGRSLSEVLLDDAGAPTVETCALRALHRLEAEGRANRRSRLRLTVAPDVSDWLNGHADLWQGALTDRIGPRFEIMAQDGAPRETAEVSTA